MTRHPTPRIHYCHGSTQESKLERRASDPKTHQHCGPPRGTSRFAKNQGKVVSGGENSFERAGSTLSMPPSRYLVTTFALKPASHPSKV
ncbi:hypothetical protein VTN77DRAFT_4104 [Rasamsonia byssochlamydoides]|uniref:uncharacterized protein n=1 Tax=Rasamsonia byssochlamydoides TaxID=89139 RepID=UPI0037431338